MMVLLPCLVVMMLGLYGDAAPARDLDAVARAGVGLLETGDLKGAEKKLREVIRGAPKHKHALTLLGICLSTPERTSQAIKKEAVSIFARAIAVNSRDWVAYSYVGMVYANMARRSESYNYDLLEQAVASLDQALRLYQERKATIGQEKMGDTVLQERLPPHWTRLLVKLGQGHLWLNRTAQAYSVFRVGVEWGVWDNEYQRPEVFNAGIKTQPVFDPAQLPWISGPLEDAFPVIRREYMASVAARVKSLYRTEATGLHDTHSWNELHLFRSGVLQKEACNVFPVTCALIKTQIPEASNFVHGDVKFSVMKAGTRVKPHCGKHNDRVRFHLGISVPEPSRAFILIRSNYSIPPQSWAEGKLLAFDDSFEHEVKHSGTMDRVVLIVDVVHPNCPLSGRHLVQNLDGGILARMKRNTEWLVQGKTHHSSRESKSPITGPQTDHAEQQLNDQLHRMLGSDLISRDTSLNVFFASPAASMLYNHQYGVDAVGPLLYSLIKAVNSGAATSCGPTAISRVIEFGAGYTTPFIASALLEADCALQIGGGACLHSVDDHSQKGAASESALQTVLNHINVSDVVKVHTTDFRGLSGSLLKSFGSLAAVPSAVRSFDMVWWDAEHANAALKEYWPLLGMVRPASQDFTALNAGGSQGGHGGLFLLHNLAVFSIAEGTWLTRDVKKKLKQQLPDAKPGRDYDYVYLIEPHKQRQGSLLIIHKKGSPAIAKEGSCADRESPSFSSNKASSSMVLSPFLRALHPMDCGGASSCAVYSRAIAELGYMIVRMIRPQRLGICAGCPQTMLTQAMLDVQLLAKFESDAVHKLHRQGGRLSTLHPEFYSTAWTAQIVCLTLTDPEPPHASCGPWPIASLTHTTSSQPMGLDMAWWVYSTAHASLALVWAALRADGGLLAIVCDAGQPLTCSCNHLRDQLPKPSRAAAEGVECVALVGATPSAPSLTLMRKVSRSQLYGQPQRWR